MTKNDNVFASFRNVSSVLGTCEDEFGCKWFVMLRSRSYDPIAVSNTSSSFAMAGCEDPPTCGRVEKIMSLST